MNDRQQPRIEFLEVDPQDSPAHRAPELPLPDDEQLAQEYRNETPATAPTSNVIRIRQERSRRPGKVKSAIYAGTAALALVGAVNIYRGLTSGGGSHMSAEATAEETRVTVYENPPLELAGIDSDLSLEMTAGYDRTGPIPGIDINPINNMYTFSQKNLTTHTEATVTVGFMEVVEGVEETTITLGGEMDLSKASIDWNEEEFAGADITGTSYSVGNDLKDEIDNDALEILQGSAGVAAACGIMDEDIQPVIASGVEKFLSIVNPHVMQKDKPVRVIIDDLETQTQGLYIEKKDELEDVLRDIEADYDGKDDTFDADISQILDCHAQNIRLVQSSARS